MEACATANNRGREIAKLEYMVRLIPPIYVKLLVKRQKNDGADAEAITEAASRQNMRFVAEKTEEQQAGAMIFRARDLLVRQRTQLIDALRGHLAEDGIVAAQGVVNVERLQKLIDDPAVKLPAMVRDLGQMYLDQIALCSDKVAPLEKSIRLAAAKEETTARLQTMPGIGPFAALAVAAFALPMESFRKGRGCAAWLGLVPRLKSTGGKQVLDRTSKMSRRDIRKLLIIGAMIVVRWAARKGAPAGSRLARMLARKPRMLVAVALANKMARSTWAMLTGQEDYRDPMVATA